MQISNELLNEIVNRILTVTNPFKIFLFGSAAAGNMNKDSDVDIAIIEEECQNIRQEQHKIQLSLRGVGYPFDIIVMTINYFENTKDVIGGLAFPINRTGKLLYARS